MSRLGRLSVNCGKIMGKKNTVLSANPSISKVFFFYFEYFVQNFICFRRNVGYDYDVIDTNL